MAVDLETSDSMASREARALRVAARKAAQAAMAQDASPADQGTRTKALRSPTAARDAVCRAHARATAERWTRVDGKTRIVDPAAGHRVLGCGITAAQAWADAAAKLSKPGDPSRDTVAATSPLAGAGRG